MADAGPDLHPDPGSDPGTESKVTLTEKQKTRLIYLSERAGVPVEEAIAKNMSQRQLKKMASKLRYDAILRSKRKEEKETRKKYRREKRLQDSSEQKPQKKVPILMKDSKNRVSVVIDMNFTDLMSDSDSKKLRKQILRCYSMNRGADAPVHLYLTSCSQKMQQQLNGSNSGFQNWDIHVSEQTYDQLFASEEQRKSLVYLTRDSDKVLPDASQIQSSGRIYVIGGLVDHNAHKNLTLTRAQSQGMEHARLPIDEHLKMCRTQVLTVNQVFELLLLVSQGTEWPDALKSVIPQRKIHPDFKSGNESKIPDQSEVLPEEAVVSSDTNDDNKETVPL